MKQKIIIGLIISTLALHNANSQPFFYSQSLQNLYHLLPEAYRLTTPVADTIVYASGIVPTGVVPIVFNWDKHDVLVHIGYRFLEEEMRQFFNTAIVKFLEREILTLLITDNLNQRLRMNRDNRMFIMLNGNTPPISFYRSSTGLPYLLQRVSGMSILHEERQRYTVNIYCEEGQTLAFQFIADAELLSGMDKKERDEHIAIMLSRHRARAVYSHTQRCGDDMMQIHNDSVFVCRGNMFEIPQINSNLYYIKSGDSLKLAFGINWIVETLQNAMLAPSERNYTMQIAHRVYGGITHRYEVSSHDFFDFFSDEYYKFFGVEAIDRDTLTGTLVLASRNAATIHLAFVSVNVWDLLNGGTMNIQLDTNIPQHNVQTLFGIGREGNNEYQLNINIR